MWTRIYLLIRLEKHAESIELAQTFMRECRTCPHAADAAVYIAERAFSEGRLVDAQRYYQLAANIRRAPAETRAFAYYKLAWIGVNRNDTAMSLRALERAQRLGGDLLRREVRRDAIRVLVSSRPFDAQRILNAARPFAEDASGYERLIDRIEEQLRSDSRGADADALHVAR